MQRLLEQLRRWFAKRYSKLSAGNQLLVVVLITFMVVRVIFPVWHLWDGYLIHIYPFRESELCLRQRADCQVDRSNTAIQAGSFGLLAVGILLAHKKRKK